MSKTIAIVEDDADQRGNYAHALQAQGYAIHQYANRQTALDGFDRALPDLAILDIMLEDEMDGGFDLCRDLRQRSPHMPIIFLTARDSDVDRVSGLRLDAWDYITKPVNLQFLAVRVASLFRIAETLQADSARPSALSIGELALDQNTMSVSWRGGALNLTLTEFWLIEALARQPGHVKTYEALMQITRQSYVEKNTINGYVRRIRKKFKEVDRDFSMIETVFGVGYRWKSE
ncbi:MAG: response regulator [Gammaproteobacteria bacterium]|nr:response regulator [Gammaproteobacteria bacterium]MDA7990337.1 response regulator [Gammaproteobacteria bacterium]MDA8007361.1 response regulator [Gammaproteobacteria bacterium]MDA8011146.1 response regulator [Gammaproteobacteria bacterium]MDA8014977.1 response regulator [Gammaproteobacteria bacterium]